MLLWTRLVLATHLVSGVGKRLITNFTVRSFRKPHHQKRKTDSKLQGMGTVPKAAPPKLRIAQEVWIVLRHSQFPVAFVNGSYHPLPMRDLKPVALGTDILVGLTYAFASLDASGAHHHGHLYTALIGAFAVKHCLCDSQPCL